MCVDGQAGIKGAVKSGPEADERSTDSFTLGHETACLLCYRLRRRRAQVKWGASSYSKSMGVNGMDEMRAPSQSEASLSMISQGVGCGGKCIL